MTASTLGRALTEVQSEQPRLLQAHGLLTTPRMSHILDYDAESLRWVADNWQVSTTAEANAEVRRWQARHTPWCSAAASSTRASDRLRG